MFYIGSSNNIERRVLEHQDGKNTSTRNRQPLELVYFEGHLAIDDARRRERYFKTTKGRVTLRQMIRTTLEADSDIA